MDEKIDFKYNLKIYWNLVKRYKWLIFLLLFLALIIESVNVGEKFLFKLIVDNGEKFGAGVVAKEILVGVILFVAVIYAGFVFLKVVSRWFHLYLINKLDGNLIFDLKSKYFNHLVGLSHGFHTTHKTGSLIARLTRGGKAIERMNDTLVFNFIPLIFQFSVATISLFYFDKISSLIIFCIIVVFLSYGLINQRIQRKANLEANNAEDIEKANIGDIFTNIDSIKYYGKEEFIKGKFAGLAEETKKKAIRHWNYSNWLGSGQLLIAGIGTFALLFFSIRQFLSGQISLGTLVFVYTVFVGLLGALYSFTQGMRDFYRTLADFDALFQYSKIENDIKDKSDAGKMIIGKGEVNFENISFNYGKRKIFENLNLKIKPNERVALVGHSGCGKTTLIKLLYRLYDVDSGSINIDGENIGEFNQESLRAEMSVVPQECVLFDDTIYNNIIFSNPKASRKEVMKAIKFAQLDKIIDKFPNKEKTIVGERGVKLSGGEKQRVSIARAILANKKILVLDEATSSLDSETEHEIQEDLDELMSGRTSIIIAHRLSTIMNSDRIIVMKNGKIIQEGRHSDLITKQGEYRKLWNLQKGGYIKE